MVVLLLKGLSGERGLFVHDFGRRRLLLLLQNKLVQHLENAFLDSVGGLAFADG